MPSQDPELDRLLEPNPPKKHARPKRRQDHRLNPDKAPYQWIQVECGAIDTSNRAMADDPWVRWGYLGTLYPVGRIGALAGIWVSDIIAERGGNEENIGFSFHRGVGDQEGKFAIEVVKYRTNSLRKMVKVTRWPGGKRGWRFNAKALGKMQLIGFSHLERDGNFLIGELGDRAGYATFGKHKTVRSPLDDPEIWVSGARSREIIEGEEASAYGYDATES